MPPALAGLAKNTSTATGVNKQQGAQRFVPPLFIMAASLILLTGKAEWPFLRDVLKEQADGLQLAWAPNGQELEYTCGGQDVSEARLISFCSSVIVRPEILSLFNRPAYNFHPGPPTYPGVYSANFAVYEGATRFGATAHVMTDKVDGGPIVGVDWFDVPDGISSERLEERAFTHLFQLFMKLAPALVDPSQDLPLTEEKWSGPTRTTKEFEELSNPPAVMSEDERRLRERAFGPAA